MIQSYPCKREWPDLPHFNSNLSNSHSSSCLIHGTLFLQTNTLALLLQLRLPRHLWLSSLPLALLFKLQCKTCPLSLLNTCQYHLTPFALPSEPPFPSIPISIRSSVLFSPSVLHHTLLLPLLSRSFSKLPFHFPSNTMSHSHIT